MRRMIRARARAAILVMVAAASLSALLAPAPAAGQQQDDSAGTGSSPPPDEGRVLLLSLPGLTWEDVDEHDLPHIEGFLEDAAMASHAPRGVRVRSRPGGAYLTISAGARAIGHPSVDGQQLDVENRSAGSAAGEIFERRTGVEPDGDYVALSWPAVVRRNDAQPYDAELGLLAETLMDAGLGVSVVGNADGTDTVADSHERQVGLAVVTPDGVVPSGDLDVDLLVADDTTTARPFGRKIVTDRFVQRFTEHWEEPDTGLVVAEASDMARTMRYRDRVDTDRYEELWEQSLAEADALAGRLLAEVDPERDSVLLLAPYNLPGERDLTVAALRTPDARGGGAPAPGYLRSASTQRVGYVTLVDIAPTILDLFGLERPSVMEGRPFEVVRSGDSLSTRVDRLVSANAASRFREHLLVPTTLVIVVLLGIVCSLAIAALARPDRPVWVGRLVNATALFTLTLMPLSYVTRAFPLEDLGLGFYWAFLLLGALVVAAGANLLGGWLDRPRLALVVGLCLAALVPIVDVTGGSWLSLSAAFGYSPTGNSRLYGLSNYTLGMFAGAACLLAALVGSRGGRQWPGRAWRFAAVGIMVAALVVIGVPFWGANVGGILSFSPAVVLFAALALGSHIKLRTMLVGFVVATGLAIGVFAAIDLARPSSQRAHLGRLMERVGDEGPGTLLAFIERKGLAAAEASFSTFWTAAVVIAIAFAVSLYRLPERPLDRVRAHTSLLHTGLLATFTLAVLGSIANDSGAIVAGTAMLVVLVTLVCLTLEPDPTPESSSPAQAESSSSAGDGSNGTSEGAADLIKAP